MNVLPPAAFLAAIEPPGQGSTPISSRAELASINPEGRYHLTADIDLSDGAWTPVGNELRPFEGVFDGQGHVIRGLTVAAEHYHAGLFGVTSPKGIIQNAGLEGTDIKAHPGYGWNHKGESAGGICAYNKGTVANCYNTGAVASFSDNNSPYAGGIVGYNEGVIRNCFNAASVSAGNARTNAVAGGISAYNKAGSSISGCFNTGSVTAFCVGWHENLWKDYSCYIGGISGYGADNSSVKNSYWSIESIQAVNDSPLPNADKKGVGYGADQTAALTAGQIERQSSHLNVSVK